MVNLTRALQQTLEHEIPLTRHLQLQVLSYNEQGLTLGAPLAPNINHKLTAFAGSLNSLVTLAGWGLLWLILQEQAISARVVIQDSSCSYVRPVNDDFTAFCQKPASAEIARIVEALGKRGRARIELHAEICNATGVAVLFTGRYVIIRAEERAV